MSARILWTATFALCIVALIAGFVYAYRLPSEESSPLPILVAAPFGGLARISWRALRRAA
jgi:hypothetical protein